MKKLYNTTDKRVLKTALLESQPQRLTVSLYRYAKIRNPLFFRDYLFIHWSEFGVLGRTYIAEEGINAQISMPLSNFDAFREHLYSISFLDKVRLNTAVEDDGRSFFALKIKVRKKIVADGIEDPSFDPSQTGKHLGAEEFNTLTDDPETILIDMRNHYESEVGHFEGAILPDVDTFREEIAKVEELVEGQRDKNIVMYCTGGIRCEKASAYLRHKGFQNVHQLEGGIIKYAHDVREKGLRNKYRGVNFVFDERLAERISDDVIAHCHLCGTPYDHHSNCANEGCHILFIQCDNCRVKYENCCSEVCRSVIHLPESDQRQLRKGKEAVRNVFHKGRGEKLLFKPNREKVLSGHPTTRADNGEV
ncbi:MAG: rhodanese-related sulfurtransferase [Crocinitomicaceae bacterium]|nr:rhodanese-related sulfurtransferase [Crocinitomicaceae bacterium]